MTTEVLADFNYFERFPHPVKQPLAFDIEDVRSLDSKACGLTIDQAGFEYVKHRSEFCEQKQKENKNFADHEQISPEQWKAGYVKELEEILRGVYGMQTDAQPPFISPNTKNHVFHPVGQIVRESKPVVAGDDFKDHYNNRSAAGPAVRVHGDVVGVGLRGLLSKYFGKDAQEAATAPGRRLIFFSVWRPLQTVHRDPLGVIDARTVDPTELYIGERYFDHLDLWIQDIHVAPTPGRNVRHQWYYMSAQTPEDVLVLKHYDSKYDGWEHAPDGNPFPCALHGAFELADTNHLPVRQSVEYRIAMVVDE